MRSALVCDDHAMMREAIAGLIALAWPETGIEVAEDFPHAWSAMAKQPDLCVCDLSMPGARPLNGIAELRMRSPRTPILVVTGNEDDALLLDLFSAGIAGFVPKTARSAVIEAAIKVVLAGERYLPQRILHLTGAPEKNQQETVASGGMLSARHIEILRLVAAGQSNKEAARSLAISPSTIKAHLAAAMVILGATNRTEAVVNAKMRKLI